MMALAATGRRGAALTMMAEMDAGANANNGDLVTRIARPICDAVLAFGEGAYAYAVQVMRPVLGEMYRLGGSHAQQDVLEQLYLHAAMRAGLDDDARLLLERVAGRHPVPVHRRIGYRDAAARLGFS
jgi:ABC-type transport system involved in cytochrome c biogenesis permease component